MFRRYNNKKRKHIDGFFVVCATPKETGLPYDILLDSLGAEKRFPGCPRLGVVIDDYVVPVSISSNPVVLSESSFRDSDKILDWVKKNKNNAGSIRQLPEKRAMEIYVDETRLFLLQGSTDENRGSW